jgi:KDO2-lipid IV(A) lauroyltransferase
VRRRTDYPLYLLMRAVVAGAHALPRRAALATGAALGAQARAPLGLRRAVAEANLAIAFPERSGAERDAICRRMYAHWGRMAVAALRAAATDGRENAPVGAGAEEALRLIRDLLARGRGLLALTAHLGDWEGAAVWLGSHGMSVTTVWKPQSNPYVAGYLDRLRAGLGIDAIPMPEARAGVLAALREGKLVALVADQAPVRSGVWVPFFGRPTKTFTGPGHFAARTGAPVVFGALLDDGAGGNRVHAEVLDDAPLEDPEAEVVRVATRYRARLEALVRTVPEQYLWTHRLWKERPPPAP